MNAEYTLLFNFITDLTELLEELVAALKSVQLQAEEIYISREN